MRKKLVLSYVDSLRTDMLERAVAKARRRPSPSCSTAASSIARLRLELSLGHPGRLAEMVTGVGADRHWISGMNWYHRLERRYVEYGSSFEASRAFGLFRSLYDLVYNMNLAHLSPDIETVFESLDDAGNAPPAPRSSSTAAATVTRSASTGCCAARSTLRRLKFRHHTWGPAELFYGDLYASRPVPCKSSSIPGNRDEYSACCAAELARGGSLRLPAPLAARQRQLLSPSRARGDADVDRARPTAASAARRRRRRASTGSSPITR